MKVSTPKVELSPLGEGRQRALVTVVYEKGIHPPEDVWIDVPGSAGGITTSGNPWAVALLPLAATLDEPLTLPAPVDATLLENLKQVLRVWRSWYPYVADVPITVDGEATPGSARGDRVGALFSGGVDSFYTLLRERGDAHPSERVNIQDLITIWGFDIPLANAEAFGRLRARFRQVAAAGGKGLIDVATNLRETRWREANWGEIGHGCALAAVCHALEGRLGCVLIPSTGGYRDLHPWASHPLTDPLLSSAGLTFIHDGASARRVDKLETIRGSQSALRELRVCWRGESDRNCGRCTKCLRTMIALELLGSPSESAFPRSGVLVHEAKRLHCRWSWDYRELRDLVALARTRGRSDLAEALESAMRQSRLRGRLLSIVTDGDRRPRGRLASTLERLILRGRIR
jgi:hypothetical protein